MSRRPPLSDAERERMCALRERGWSYHRIGRELGRHPSSISWHCLMLGVDSPRARPIDTTIRGPIVVTRGGHEVRRFLLEDDKQLLEMSKAGATDSAIARALGRRPNSIRGRLATLARHDERAGR